MRRILMMCAVLWSVSLAPVLSAQPLSAFDQQLMDQEKQFVRALADKNVAYISNVVTDEFSGITTNGDYSSKDEIVTTAREGYPKDARIYDIHVIRLSDSSAVVSYKIILPGERPRYRHMSDTWILQNRQWKLRFQQATPNLWSAADLD